MDTLQQEHDRLNFRLSSLGINPSISIADRQGLGLLAHASFEASEGEYAPAPCLMLTLCTANTGRMRRAGDGPVLEGMLRPGTVAIALPNTAASGYWSNNQMLGIAVNLKARSQDTDDIIMPDNLEAAAARLHNDVLLSSVMTAMWRDAEFHGVSGAFFEQGIGVLLRRLASCSIPQKIVRVYPLKGPRLTQVLELMESRLGDDIRVTELAALTGQDVRTFTRAFGAAMGVAPYAYFTLRRMEFAKRLLSDKKKTITEIAFEVGYTNPGKFSAAFRRSCGMSPGVWRQMQKER